ncbi:unnamed protein product [Alopecurus aequalis]
MEIFVKNMYNVDRKITVKVDPSDTIYVVKAKIYEQLCLLFGGELLEDGCTLADYDIQDGSTLRLDLRRMRKRMLIRVKTLTGKIVPLVVHSTDTIHDVKSKIWAEEGIPVEQQRLNYGGELMENSHTLENCNILEESTLHLILRLGGRCSQCAA